MQVQIFKRKVKSAIFHFIPLGDLNRTLVQDNINTKTEQKEAHKLISGASDNITIVETVDRFVSDEAEKIPNEEHQELTQQQRTQFCNDGIKTGIRFDSNNVKWKNTIYAEDMNPEVKDLSFNLRKLTTNTNFS